MEVEIEYIAHWRTMPRWTRGDRFGPTIRPMNIYKLGPWRGRTGRTIARMFMRTIGRSVPPTSHSPLPNALTHPPPLVPPPDPSGGGEGEAALPALDPPMTGLTRTWWGPPEDTAGVLMSPEAFLLGGGKVGG